MRGVYAGEVHNVAAGYARNYLVPKKMAVYATSRNFERCGLVDPAIAAKAEAAAQKMVDDEEGNEDLEAADVLRRYLRNKMIRIKRNVDPNQPIMCHPGHVDHKNLREKLSKQLKIDLEDHETIHIRNELVMGLEEKPELELMQLLREMDVEDVPVMAGDEEDGAESNVEAASGGDDDGDGDVKECDVKTKQLGDYVAKITLAGGYVVPLKFTIGRR